MIRVARERISTLFALAEREAGGGHRELAHRYVALARRIGTRYNVRLLPEYREVYCRGCSAYWIEGVTVRTRLRSGRRSRTCLRCGRVRRTAVRASRGPTSGRSDVSIGLAGRDDEALVGVPSDAAPSEPPDDEAEEG